MAAVVQLTKKMQKMSVSFETPFADAKNFEVTLDRATDGQWTGKHSGSTYVKFNDKVYCDHKLEFQLPSKRMEKGEKSSFSWSVCFFMLFCIVEN